MRSKVFSSVQTVCFRVFLRDLRKNLTGHWHKLFSTILKFVFNRNDAHKVALLYYLP